MKKTPKKKAREALPIDPHDRFFKLITKNERHNLELLRLSLPPDLYADFDWNALRSEANTYVDENFRERRTDLILSANFKNAGNPAKIIFLVEHKAQKMPQEVLLQLLEYQNRIYQKNGKAPIAIIPIIIYHGPVKAYSGPS